MNKYLKNQAKCKLKVGDLVKVVRKAKDFEQGWNNDWSSDMDQSVGNTYKIMRFSKRGIYLTNYRAYPWFVLELVKKPIHISIDGHTVFFDDEGKEIEVGCVTVDYKTVKKIYKTMKAMRQ